LAGALVVPVDICFWTHFMQHQLVTSDRGQAKHLFLTLYACYTAGPAPGGTVGLIASYH